MRNIACLLCCLLTVACSPIRTVEIQVYNPASFTFPKEAQTVMIVNNAAQQPDSIGHTYFDFQLTEHNQSISCDSVAYDFCQSLGRAIAETPLFEDVRICDDTLRRDSLYNIATPMMMSEANKMFDYYGVDAIISLDKLSCKTVNNRSHHRLYLHNEMNYRIVTTITAELRTYCRGQKSYSEVYTVIDTDSLFWRYEYESLGDVMFNYDIKTSMHILADYMGKRLSRSFAPYWTTDNRWYYCTPLSQWRLAASYTAAERWHDAAEIWETILKHTDIWNEKAKLLSNIALCNEFDGNMTVAASCAKQSYELFRDNAGENDDNTKLQKQYADILQERLKNDIILSKQLKEEMILPNEK